MNEFTNFISYQYGMDGVCKTPPSDCTAKGGPYNCPWHRSGLINLCDVSQVDGLGIDEISKSRIKFLCENTTEECKKFLSGTMEQTIFSIKKKYPSIKIPKFHLICAKFSPESLVGITELDHIRTHEAFICVGRPNLKLVHGYSYCHSDERGYQDALRHEIGHLMTTQKVVDRYKIVVGRIVSSVGLSGFAKFVRSNVSEYAVESGGDEIIAELFSIVTDEDDTQRKKIIPELVDFVENDMIGGSQMNMALDQEISGEKLDSDENWIYIPSLCCEPATRRPDDSYTWDSENGKWIKKSEVKNIKRHGIYVRSDPNVRNDKRLKDMAKRLADGIKAWCKENGVPIKPIDHE